MHFLAELPRMEQLVSIHDGIARKGRKSGLSFLVASRLWHTTRKDRL